MAGLITYLLLAIFTRMSLGKVSIKRVRQLRNQIRNDFLEAKATSKKKIRENAMQKPNRTILNEKNKMPFFAASILS